AQNLVGFGDLFELFLGCRLLVGSQAVGMVLHGETAISLLDLRLVRTALHPEAGVIVQAHSSSSPTRRLVWSTSATILSYGIRVGPMTPMTQWKASPLAQARIRELSLKDEDELQSYFTRRMDEFLTAHGRSLVGWDEILEGGLAPNAVVMSWRGIDGGIAAARAGHDVVMAPGSHTYFDHYQAADTTEPLAIGGFLPLDTVYAYEPVPAALTPDEARHVLRPQGQLWTES